MPNHNATEIILSTGSLFHLPLSDIFEIAHQAGFSGIELIVDINPDTKDSKKINRLIKEKNIKVKSVHAPMSHCAIFGETAETITHNTVLLAKQINAKNIVFHPRIGNNENYATFIIKQINEHQDKKIQITLENLPLKEKKQSVSRDFDPTYIANQYSPICLDTSHVATSRLNFKSTINTVINKIGHVHLADSTTKEDDQGIIIDEHLPIGTGKLPLGWFVSTLIKQGYSGLYCFELRPSFFDGMPNKEIIIFLQKLISRFKYLYLIDQ